MITDCWCALKKEKKKKEGQASLTSWNFWKTQLTVKTGRIEMNILFFAFLKENF